MSTVASALTKDDRLRAADLGVAALKKFYGSRQDDLVQDAAQLAQHIDRTLKRAGFHDAIVKSRSKTQESACDKLERKCFDERSDYAPRILNGQRPESILTDLMGVRVTCRFSDQIDPISALIKGNYETLEDQCADYRRPKTFNAFGYAALHLICRVPDSWRAKIFFSNVPFEVQVRTSLQDVWSVLNWDIAYTIEDSLPYEVSRGIATIAALFHMVDEEFIRLRDFSSLNKASSAASSGSISLADATRLALSRREIDLDSVNASEFHRAKAKLDTFIRRDDVNIGRDDVERIALFIADQDRFRFLVDDSLLDLAKAAMK
jgi:ppGpp synthetase/RelA/SpoT-type nucleotidyltranferase